MPEGLYLDAARMGRMTPSAQWALHDFARFAGEVGCTLYFERFLRDGFSAWPTSIQKAFPNLSCWAGISEFKQSLAALVGLQNGTSTIIASRSNYLMKLASRLLFRGGRSVVMTDLAWPAYERLLKGEARRSNSAMLKLRFRTRIYHGQTSVSNFVDRIVNAVERSNAGGVFLPAVSHDGMRLPVAEIIAAVRQLDRNILVAVDGSQAFGQLPLDLSQNPCDFFLAGCHKWLGSHLPLGVGYCPNPDTRPFLIENATPKLDDPLWSFLESLESGRIRRFSETVNVSPLFTCRGAMADQWIEGPATPRISRRLMNAGLSRHLARMTSWIPLVPLREFQTAAVLLQSADREVRACEPAELRKRFHERGIALTAYRHGIIRLSMPDVPFSTAEIGLLIQALALVHRPARARLAPSIVALSA